MLDETLTELARSAHTAVDVLGWDQPGLLCAVDGVDEGTHTAFSLRPVEALSGHPALALLRRCHRPAGGELGAALVAEMWSDPGPDTPVDGRRELRLVEVVLRDGTEVAVTAERATGAIEEHPAGGLVSVLVRASAGAPSRAPLPGPDLAVRLALLWQLSSVLVLRDAGVRLGRPRDDQWGRFAVPGGSGTQASPLGEPAWVAPVRDWGEGRRDPARLAGELRAAARRLEPCLATSFPLQRGTSEVMLTGAMLEWADDDLVCHLVDLTVPTVDQLLMRALDSLDDAHLASLVAWHNALGGPARP